METVDLNRQDSNSSTTVGRQTPSTDPQMPASEQPPAKEDEATKPVPKPKRVRTGCLTCRERHLKCDEAMPRCVNCQKSNRTCKRGVRLNFIDTQVVAPPYLVPKNPEFHVNFHDDSRDIASEYQGGFEKYAALEVEPARSLMPEVYDYAPPVIGAPVMARASLPDQNAVNQVQLQMDSYTDTSNFVGTFFSQDAQDAEDAETMQHLYGRTDPTLLYNDTPNYLSAPDEVLFMQVFVEEVGVWMDSMDAHKHVGVAYSVASRQIADISAVLAHFTLLLA